MTDKKTEYEMNNAFDDLRKKILFSRIAIIAGFIGVGGCFFIDKLPLAFACIVICLLGASQNRKYSAEINKIAGEGIVKELVFKIFDDVKYTHDGQIGSYEVNSSGLDFSYNQTEGSDLTVAKYHGHAIALSALKLIDHSSDSDGGTDAVRFNGLWTVYDSGKNFSANLSIQEKGALGRMFSGKGLETNDTDFNKKFVIKTDNEEEASNIFSKKLKSCIENLSERSKAKIAVAFLTDGKIHIGLDFKSDAFAVKSSDSEKLKAVFTERVRYITDFIDEIEKE